MNTNAAESSTEPKGKLRQVLDLPGPRALPLVGNFHQMEKGAGHRSIETWARDFGDYYRLSLGRRQMLVVSDPGEIGRILRDRPDGFRRTRLLEIILGEIGIGGVFASNGTDWRRQRKMVAAAFDPRHIKAYFVPTVIGDVVVPAGAARLGSGRRCRYARTRACVDALRRRTADMPRAKSDDARDQPRDIDAVSQLRDQVAAHAERR
jgi:hypothetical protein